MNEDEYLQIGKLLEDFMRIALGKEVYISHGVSFTYYVEKGEVLKCSIDFSALQKGIGNNKSKDNI